MKLAGNASYRQFSTLRIRQMIRFKVVGCRISVPPRKQMDNNNPKPEIERILRTVLENLRELAHTPSKPFGNSIPSSTFCLLEHCLLTLCCPSRCRRYSKIQLCGAEVTCSSVVRDALQRFFVSDQHSLYGVSSQASQMITNW